MVRRKNTDRTLRRCYNAYISRKRGCIIGGVSIIKQRLAQFQKGRVTI